VLRVVRISLAIVDLPLLGIVPPHHEPLVYTYASIRATAYRHALRICVAQDPTLHDDRRVFSEKELPKSGKTMPIGQRVMVRLSASWLKV
jgi:hypothetical protein